MTENENDNHNIPGWFSPRVWEPRYTQMETVTLDGESLTPETLVKIGYSHVKCCPFLTNKKKHTKEK